jgi:hypothetical protein
VKPTPTPEETNMREVDKRVDFGPLLSIERVSKLLRDDLEKIALDVGHLSGESPSAEEMDRFAVRIRATAHGCDQIHLAAAHILDPIRDKLVATDNPKHPRTVSTHT